MSGRTPVFVIMFLLLSKRSTLTFLDEFSRQIRLRDINKTCATIPRTWLFIRGVNGRPQRKKQALELLKGVACFTA
jgi:hypothetical protein